ncbi:hypothetical protein HYV84_02060 [Candidatus Woesearchaeota archaeon]|nr:hypothetical protein [Candidatus Woesearchaeota archaeon]
MAEPSNLGGLEREELELTLETIWEAEREKLSGFNPFHFVGFTGSGHLVANLQYSDGSSSYIVIDARSKEEVSRIRRPPRKGLWDFLGTHSVQGDKVVNYSPGVGGSGLFSVEAWSLTDGKKIWEHLEQSGYCHALDVTVTPDITYVVSRHNITLIDAEGHNLVDMTHGPEEEVNGQAAAVAKEQGMVVLVKPDASNNALVYRWNRGDKAPTLTNLEGLTGWPISLCCSHPQLLASPHYLVAFSADNFWAYQPPELKLAGEGMASGPFPHSAITHGSTLAVDTRNMGWVVFDLEEKIDPSSHFFGYELSRQGKAYMISNGLAIVSPEHIDVFPGPEEIIKEKKAFNRRRYNNPSGITRFLTDERGQVYACSDRAVFKVAGETSIKFHPERGELRKFGGA